MLGPMKNIIALLLFIMILPTVAYGEIDRSFRFSKNLDKSHLVDGKDISFELELVAFDVRDQNRLERLVIDDYRYDEPNYFVDKRRPNITFTIEQFVGGQWKSAAFRTFSQGGGASLNILTVNVYLQIGGDPDRLGTEIKKLLAESKDKFLENPENAAIELKKKLQKVKERFMPNRAGKYSISAMYSGRLATESSLKGFKEDDPQIVLKTKPIIIEIIKQKP